MYALCLRGMSDTYERTSENIFKNVCKALEPHIFISTYDNPNLQSMMNFYKPIFYYCENYHPNPWFMVATHSINCLLMVKEAIRQNIAKYDYVIMTRFDAAFDYDFKRLFAEKNITPEHFHVLCKTEKPEYVDDMLWIIPISMLDALIDTLQQIRNEHIWTHSVNIYMNARLGEGTTKTLFEGEYYLKENRPFIKLAREL
jgi:hypothetical protein